MLVKEFSIQFQNKLQNKDIEQKFMQFQKNVINRAISNDIAYKTKTEWNTIKLTEEIQTNHILRTRLLKKLGRIPINSSMMNI